MFRLRTYLVLVTFATLPQAAHASKKGCESALKTVVQELNASSRSADQERWFQLQADLRSEAELTGRLERVEDLLMSGDGTDVPELNTKAKQIREVLDVVQKRRVGRQTELDALLKEAKQDLEPRTLAYLKGSETEASLDVIQIARRILDLQGVPYRQLKLDGKHLALALDESGSGPYTLWIQKLRNRGEAQTEIYFAPSHQKTSGALAMITTDSRRIYIDPETLAQGRLSPTGVHEMNHLLEQKGALTGIPRMRNARLVDSRGVVPRGESRAYSAEAVTRYLDLRARLAEMKARNLSMGSEQGQTFLRLWNDYLTRFEYGRDFALRSAAVLTEVRQSMDQFEPQLMPDPLRTGSFRVTVMTQGQRVQSFPTSERTLGKAARAVRLALDPEIEHDRAIAGALQEAWQVQTQESAGFGLGDFDQRIERAAPAMRKVWRLSRAISPKI